MKDPLATLIDDAALDALSTRAVASPRRRINLNLHAELADPIQRLLNAAEPGTYVRPHRHRPDRWELFAILRGAMDLLLFGDDGAIARRAAITAGSGLIEIAGGTWHSFVVRTPGTIALEVKPGPYIAASDKDFAAWAPREEDAEAAQMVAWLATARVGERWPGA